MMRQLGIALVVVIATAATAWGQSNADKAEAMNEQAKAFYQAKQYQQAIDAWERAYQLDAQSGWLFNAARAYEEMGAPNKALDAYRRYLAADPSGRRAPEANARVAALEADIAKREADAKAAAARKAQIDAHLAEGRRLAAEGKATEAAAELNKAFELVGDADVVYEIAEVYRAAGDDLRAIAEYERYQTLAPTGRYAADAAAHRQALEAKSTPAGPTVGTEPPPRYRAGGSSLRTYGLVTGGVGLVALGTGVFFGMQAGSLQTEIEEAQQWSRALDDKLEDGEAAERNAIIGISIGAVAIAAGATMYILGSRSGSARSERAVQVTPTGRGVLVHGRF